MLDTIISRISLGMWRLKPSTSQKELTHLIQAAIDSGVTTFDHADIYGAYTCEEIFGGAFQSLPASEKLKAQHITKCGIKLVSDQRPHHRIKHYDLSKEHIVASAENSLKMLRIEKLDLLLLHRPSPLINPDEVNSAFTKLRKEGKVKNFGVSNFTPAQTEVLRSSLELPLVTNQIEISLMHHQPLFDGTIDYLMTNDIAPMAWSPLGGGKIFTDDDPSLQELRSALKFMAADYDMTLAQLLLAWLLAHPGNIFPVLGTMNIERLQEYAEVTGKKLSTQDWFAMLKAVKGRDVP